MRSIYLIAIAVIIVGCGGGDTYVTNEQAVPEIPTDTGQALVVTASDNATAGLSYTEVGDGSVLIDCGDGGCGIYIGEQVEPETAEEEE